MSATSAPRLDGSVGIVTGASRGIGLAIAAALRAAGARVCITGRDAGALDGAVASLGADGAMGMAGNAADPEHRRETVEAVVRRFGPVDLLVNNAGINPGFGPLIESELGILQKTYDTNVVAALGWIQEVHHASMGQRGGTIVNVASAAGLRPAAKIGAYGASKAALIALTAQLAVELAPGIRVNAVAPAVVTTAFSRPLYAGAEEEVAQRYPLGRLGTAEDVAAAVLFLLSPAAGWITGETLVLDGGLLRTGGI